MSNESATTAAHALKNGLVQYRKIVMTQDCYFAIVEAEKLVHLLLANAYRAQSMLLDQTIR